MNPNIIGRGNAMLDDCDVTIIYAISNSIFNIWDTIIINDLVRVLQTDKKASLVGFGHGLSILNVYFTADIYLHNGVGSAHMNG